MRSNWMEDRYTDKHGTSYEYINDYDFLVGFSHVGQYELEVHFVIASQLPISKWHEYIAEPTLADAIMDRLMAK